MKRATRFLLFAIFLGPLFGLSQQNADLEKRFKGHIQYLADDKLEGRETGTTGEELAATYIEESFREVGLKAPGKNNSYIQSFEFLNGKEYGPGSQLVIDDREYPLEEGWYALPYSANKELGGMIVNAGFGIQAPDLDRDDYANLPENHSGIFIMELGSPDGVHPHSKFKAHYGIRTKLETAEKNGAKAVIFVNNDPTCQEPEAGFSRKITPTGLAVVYLNSGKVEDLAGKEAWIGIELLEDMRTGLNVTGLLDNGAEHTLVIGGHLDHLGMGGEGSLYRGGPAVHNGADDNASGTGMVIELARSLKANGPKNLNYFFIGFSGEEKGLLGSNYFVSNPQIDLEKVVAMLNFDMVGRVKPDSLGIGITGVGTSPFWEKEVPGIKAGGLNIKTSESGIGPSDHTSFYLKEIPVLHFFSGTHEDYHKPSDDEEKINYDGMVRIHQYVMELVSRLGKAGEIEFTKTKDADSRKAPKFSVTLGVVPNYLFSGKGMKIDGVSEGKPAEKAGLQAGDIIIRMGDVEVPDMMGYMHALGQFEKGQKIKVEIIRDGKKMKKKVQF